MIFRLFVSFFSKQHFLQKYNLEAYGPIFLPKSSESQENPAQPLFTQENVFNDYRESKADNQPQDKQLIIYSKAQFSGNYPASGCTENMEQVNRIGEKAQPGQWFYGAPDIK